MKKLKASALLLCLILTGCSGAKVLFNKEDNKSGYTKTSVIELTRLDLGYCKPIEIQTTAADLAVAVGSLGYGIVKSEVSDWIKNKVSAYEMQYQTLTNYYAEVKNKEVTSPPDYQEMCFRFERKVIVDNSVKPENGLSFIIGFRRLGNSKAFVMTVSNVILEHSGAITTEGNGVALTIGAIISTFSEKDGAESKILSNSSTTIPNVTFSDKENDVVSSGRVFEGIPYSTPVTISVSVTENGYGVKNVKSLQETINSNSDAMKALLDIAIRKKNE